MEELFGNKGIDTSYEREILDYDPRIERPDNAQYVGISPEIILRIERSRDFTITKSLIDYDELILRIQALMDIIDDRNQSAVFLSYKKALALGVFLDITAIEELVGSYDGTGDAEIYSILSRMKASCELRRAFMDEYYRTQITDKTQIDEITEAENEKINAWLQTEQRFVQLDEEMKNVYSESEHETGTPENAAILESEMYSVESSKKTQDMLHTSLADVAYVHKNRYLMFSQIATQIEMILSYPESLAGVGIKDFIMSVSTAPDLSLVSGQLVFSFTQLQQNMNVLKGQFHMTNDNKEGFISKEQWFYQQLQTKTQVPLQGWLYDQQEIPGAFQSFANVLVQSLVETKSKNEASITDLLRFYQQEALFYDTQMALIQKKELVRLFLRIIKDTKDAMPVTNEWASQYTTTHGYPVLQEV